jgi:hypothetical protein
MTTTSTDVQAMPIKLRGFANTETFKMTTLLLEASFLAETINLARFEGREITDDQTVRLCELLDILLSVKAA